MRWRFLRGIRQLSKVQAAHENKLEEEIESTSHTVLATLLPAHFSRKSL